MPAEDASPVEWRRPSPEALAAAQLGPAARPSAEPNTRVVTAVPSSIPQEVRERRPSPEVPASEDASHVGWQRPSPEALAAAQLGPAARLSTVPNTRVVAAAPSPIPQVVPPPVQKTEISQAKLLFFCFL